MTLSPGTERAIFNISQELPRLTQELEKLNKTLGAPAEVKSNLVESLKGFRDELLKTFRETKSAVEKSVQE